MAVKKVLAINGSPRRGGNTDILIEQILDGAISAGAEVKTEILTNLNILPCRGCDGCAETKQCIIKDDLTALTKAMAQSDVWVFGTPVYYAGPTAQFKAFMDRWYSMDRDIFKDKRVIIAIPLGDKPEIARYTEGMLLEALEFQGTRSPEFLIAPHCFEAGIVRDHTELLEQAWQMGSEVVNPIESEELICAN